MSDHSTTTEPRRHPALGKWKPRVWIYLDSEGVWRYNCAATVDLGEGLESPLRHRVDAFTVQQVVADAISWTLYCASEAWARYCASDPVA